MIHRLSLSLAALLLLLRASPSHAQPSLQLAPQPAPQTQPATQPADPHTLTIAIRCPQQSFKLGDEIPITVEVTNIGDKPYLFIDHTYDFSGRAGFFKLTALTQNGKQDGQPIPDPFAVPKGAYATSCMPPQIKLQPGQSTTKTIPLNRWALITQPGTYKLNATYTIPFKGNKVLAAPPIQVLITSRTDEDMAQYIQDLSEKLQTLLASKSRPDQIDSSKLNNLLEKLMFTRDHRAIPPLIDAMYANTHITTASVSAAFAYYLPNDSKTTSLLAASATQRGLADGMFPILQTAGLTDAQLKKIIAVSLSADHPASHNAGASAACKFGDDAFTPRLISIALNTDRNNPAFEMAIYALALNRTDESVEVLRQFLKETPPTRPNAPDAAKAARRAIRMAYKSNRTYIHGRALLPDDFDKSLQEYTYPME